MSMTDENTEAGPELEVRLPTFHALEGLFFLRTEAGAVRIQKRAGLGDLGPELVLDVELEPSSWASVVAFTSARGENASTHAEALAFHEGRPAEDLELERLRAAVTHLEAELGRLLTPPAEAELEREV